MHGEEIFGPFFGMMLLTFVVWVVMYVRRLHCIISNRIDTRELTIPEKGAKLIPENVSWPAYNFRNLFVSSAWVFVALRSVHSLERCTRNIVKLRFTVYMLGAIVLWFMIIRAAWQLFAD